MSYRVLIADDEPLARERLARLVEAIPECNVCGAAADGREVLTVSAESAPDVVLLDIRMPGMDGLETAQQLSVMENPPAIIFCTAFDQYAIDAFQVQAVAYLLKPVRREALASALERARRVNRVQLESLRQRMDSGAEPPRIAVRTHRGTELIELDRIAYCTADQKYVTLVHDQGETVTDFTLKELEAQYPDTFLRIHRRTLVGRSHIKGLVKDAEGQPRVILRDRNDRLDVSRRLAPEIRQWLSNGPAPEDNGD